MAGNENALWLLGLPTSKGATDELFGESTLVVDANSPSSGEHVLSNQGTGTGSITSGDNDFCRFDSDGFYNTGNGYLKDIENVGSIDISDNFEFEWHVWIDDFTKDCVFLDLDTNLGSWKFEMFGGQIQMTTPDNQVVSETTDWTKFPVGKKYRFKAVYESGAPTSVALFRLNESNYWMPQSDWTITARSDSGSAGGTLYLADKMDTKFYYARINNITKGEEYIWDLSDVRTMGTAALLNLGQDATYETISIVDGAPATNTPQYLDKKNYGNYIYNYAGSGFAMTTTIAPEDALVFSSGDIEIKARLALAETLTEPQSTEVLTLFSSDSLTFSVIKNVNNYFYRMTINGTEYDFLDSKNIWADGGYIDFSFRYQTGILEAWYKPISKTSWVQLPTTKPSIIETPPNVSGVVNMFATSVESMVYKIEVLDGVGGPTLLSVDLDRANTTLNTQNSFPALMGGSDQVIDIDRTGTRILVEDPSWLFRSGDTIKAQDSDLGLDGDFTVLLQHRRHMGSTDNVSLVSKYLTSGWQMKEQTDGSFTAFLSDGVNENTASSVVNASVKTTQSAFVWDNTAKVLSTYIDGENKVDKAMPTVGNATSSADVILGAIGLEQEVFGLVIVPSALTDDQVKNISNYYLGISALPNNMEFGFWLVSVGSETFAS
jgi:hypothetical protein